jgi:transposase
MTENELFTRALNLGAGWEVCDIKFDLEQKELRIHVRTIKGSLHQCGTCGKADCRIYDHGKEREWRHMNFFQYRAIIIGKPPRVDCDVCNTPKTAECLWARERSGFSLYFEALMVMLAKAMPMNEVSRLLGEHDTTLWPILHHYVDEARQEQTWEEVKRIAIDETSRAKGHAYVSLVMDLDTRKVLHVAEGKDQRTLFDFKEQLLQKCGHPDDIEELCMDMSPSFIAGAKNYFPNVEITYDKFHVMKIINTAIDETRRKEQRTVADLKDSRYAWLKNEENLTTKQKEKLYKLKDEDLKTAKAYHLKLTFTKLWEQETPEKAKAFLDDWYYWATHSQIPDMVKAAKTIRQHEAGILRWFTSKVTNGILEAINGLVQSAKRRARGYRSVKNLKAMIYLIAGGLMLKTVEI